MAKRSQRHHLTAVPSGTSDTPPAVELVGCATVSMTDEQYAAAVRALAVLIANWRNTRAIHGNGVDGQLAA